MHIIITGASSGIGESIAREYGSNPDHSITLVARRKDKLVALADSLQAQTLVVPCDLSAPENVPATVQLAVDQFGPVDMLVNNAGMNCFKGAGDVTHAEAAKLFNLNVLSPMALVEAVLPAMKDAQSGSIVNVSSVAAVNTPTGMAHYAATKAALAKYSEALHVELKDHGIHVVTVYPGPVATPMEVRARETFGGSFGAADKLPMGTPEELALKINKAITAKTRKLYYPDFYRSAFMFPNLSQCLTEKFSPGLESLAS